MTEDFVAEANFWLGWFNGLMAAGNIYFFLTQSYRYTTRWKLVVLSSIGLSAIVFFRHSGLIQYN